MAKQFYNVEFPTPGEDKTPKTIHFDKPVKKICVHFNNHLVAFSVGAVQDLTNYFVCNVYFDNVIDFQSANTGKGVTDITLWPFSGSNAIYVTVSVIEYGSDGDNEYFK